ncbi:MAG: inositol oxygenase family protein [Myxococcota bacterium]|nr:inositol oxygenase family protein [Myxococcota bacterium]
MSGNAATPGFRDYDATPRESVRALYAEKHALQTLALAREKEAEFGPLSRRRMSVWEAVQGLSEIVDDSDPDLSLSQLDHALQTAEALRADEAPRWLVLTGFVHDLGKVLCLFGEPQWAVVGDTYPVGCAFAPEIVHHALFDANPDVRDETLSTPLGIYSEGCGLSALTMAWGHDEYLHHVLRPHWNTPELEPALAIVRYHSFYAWHEQGAYRRFMAPGDEERLAWVRRFNRYDLYSKADVPPDWPALRGYYEDLVAEFLPDTLSW